MGPEQWLFLQWHEHKGSLISTFEKLFERNTFVDCTLAAEGQYLNVHKMILSACSPYFEILLNENRDKHPIIILKDVKFRSLKSIIEYMYRGEANVLSTEIKDFLSAAETLQIKGLGKQGGGDTKNAPPKELRDFMEADSLTTGSQVISHDSGEKEMWRNPDLASVLTETSCESATQNNTAFSQGDHLPTKKIAPQRIAVPVMRVEEENESKWPKMEDNDEPRKCLKAVMPTLNLGTHAMEPVHHATVDKVLDLNVCSTSNQSVPSTNDAQMSIELTRKNELEPEPQQAHGTRETEEVETASVASSAIEVSDTTEEWAEEDIEEGPTPSQATGHSAAAGTDESHPLFDASNMTRDSVSRNIANDHQACRSQETGGSDAGVLIQRLVTVLETVLQRIDDKDDNHPKGNATVPLSSSARTSAQRGSEKELDSVSVHETSISFIKSASFAMSSKVKERDSKETDVVDPRSEGLLAGRFPRPNIHLCPICQKSFPWLSSLKLHMKTHKREKMYKCDTCNYTTKKIQNLIKHQRTHASKSDEPQRMYSCPVCAESFPWLCDIKRHIRTHRIDHLYRCDECGFVAKRFNDLSRHHCSRARSGYKLAINTSETSFNWPKSSAKLNQWPYKSLSDSAVSQDYEHAFTEFEEGSQEPFLCHECEEEFTDAADLLNHYHERHGYPRETEDAI